MEIKEQARVSAEMAVQALGSAARLLDEACTINVRPGNGRAAPHPETRLIAALLRAHALELRTQWGIK